MLGTVCLRWRLPGIPRCQRVRGYDRSMMSWKSVLAVGRHPELWAEGVRSLFAIAPRGWWKRRPFLPVPDRAYLSWRSATAQGSAEAGIDAAELVAYLRWRRQQHRPLGKV